MSRRPPLLLALLLLSFPQFVETIYSPALPLIATGYRVTPAEAGQTLSLWFAAFAFGVVAWGRLSDLWGRRPALLAGLTLYAAGAAWAMVAGDFSQLLAARLMSAFGAAVGSIVTQTALRDSHAGAELGRVFAVLGLALAISPAVGLFAGQFIAANAGHRGVFATLGVLAALLLGLSFWRWPETRPATVSVAPFWPTFRAMLRDRGIWRSALLIAAFNAAIFSWYQLGPFRFAALEHPGLSFGQSGFLLAAGALAGALMNRALLRRGWTAEALISLGTLLLVAGAALVIVLAALLPQSLAFLSGMTLVSSAYAIAIPNVLAIALRAYADRFGTAGAILSLVYYNLLGAGLVLAGYGQRLELALAVCALLAVFMRARPTTG
ncbi:MFS transporter [Myxococcus landrumensis]|uniref:MFS transporter n=1 Tax=Myxococcus landrumensis TaxID=2813577 RepID=A0ABX7NDI8_9BACT|nr:MFS transporter [Myxococcus landrumus]QSQ16886.1 MFS transporter [Myxococcus landrumus]